VTLKKALLYLGGVLVVVYFIKRVFAERPNILVIVSDDQSRFITFADGTRIETVSKDFMPKTKQYIFDEGLVFNNGFVTTSLCGPFRHTLYSGQYAHTTGVRVNQDVISRTTFMEVLHAYGYYTGLFGKYINSWGKRGVAPGFDRWVGVEGCNGYVKTNPTLNVEGVCTAHTGYNTYILRDYALNFLRNRPRNKPFLLLFTPPTPHGPYAAAPEDENLFPSMQPHRPPSHNEADVSDKPSTIRGLPLLTSTQIANIDGIRLTMTRMLVSLDRAVGSIIEEIESQGQLSNTLIFYASDNGFFYGEHRISPSKNRPYQESVKVPFAMRYDKLNLNGVRQEIIASIDIAPTIYQLTGIRPPHTMDGRSITSLLSNPRSAILYEHGGITSKRCDSGVFFYMPGYDTYFSYVENFNRELQKLEKELYVLASDPYELDSQHKNPLYKPVMDYGATVLRQLNPTWQQILEEVISEPSDLTPNYYECIDEPIDPSEESLVSTEELIDRDTLARTPAGHYKW